MSAFLHLASKLDPFNETITFLLDNDGGGDFSGVLFKFQCVIARRHENARDAEKTTVIGDV